MHIRRRTLAAGALALIVGLPGASGALASTSAESEVEALARAWFAAFVARDGRTLDRLTAADFVMTQDGEKVERMIALGMPVNSPDYFVRAIEVEGLAVRVDGDKARVTGVIRRKDDFGGRVFDTRVDVEQTWRREASGWRIVTDRETQKKG